LLTRLAIITMPLSVSIQFVNFKLLSHRSRFSKERNPACVLSNICEVTLSPIVSDGLLTVAGASLNLLDVG